MPTKHERISVVKDPELAEAIAAARREPGAERRPAATQGAAVQRAEEAHARRLILRDLALRRRALAEMVQSGNPPWDPDVLANVDELAWGV